MGEDAPTISKGQKIPNKKIGRTSGHSMYAHKVLKFFFMSCVKNAISGALKRVFSQTFCTNIECLDVRPKFFLIFLTF